MKKVGLAIIFMGLAILVGLEILSPAQRDVTTPNELVGHLGPTIETLQSSPDATPLLKLITADHLSLENSVAVLKASAEVADENLRAQCREAAALKLEKILNYGSAIEVLAHLPLVPLFKENLKNVHFCRFNSDVGSEREQLQVELIRTQLRKFHVSTCEG